MLTEQKVCMGESWLRSQVQTERTHDRGQDSPIQTDLARLIRYLLYGKDKNNFNSFSVTGLSWFVMNLVVPSPCETEPYNKLLIVHINSLATWKSLKME